MKQTRRNIPVPPNTALPKSAVDGLNNDSHIQISPEIIARVFDEAEGHLDVALTRIEQTDRSISAAKNTALPQSAAMAAPPIPASTIDSPLTAGQVLEPSTGRIEQPVPLDREYRWVQAKIDRLHVDVHMLEAEILTVDGDMGPAEAERDRLMAAIEKRRQALAEYEQSVARVQRSYQLVAENNRLTAKTQRQEANADYSEANLDRLKALCHQVRGLLGDDRSGST